MGENKIDKLEQQQEAEIADNVALLRDAIVTIAESMQSDNSRPATEIAPDLTKEANLAEGQLTTPAPLAEARIPNTTGAKAQQIATTLDADMAKEVSVEINKLTENTDERIELGGKGQSNVTGQKLVDSDLLQTKSQPATTPLPPTATENPAPLATGATSTTKAATEPIVDAPSATKPFVTSPTVASTGSTGKPLAADAIAAPSPDANNSTQETKNQTAYEILGLSPNASEFEIRAAFVRSPPPPSGAYQDDNPYLQAYRKIKTPELRAVYDRHLAEEGRLPQSTQLAPTPATKAEQINQSNLLSEPVAQKSQAVQSISGQPASNPEIQIPSTHKSLLPTAYDVLGLSPHATQDEIEAKSLDFQYVDESGNSIELDPGDPYGKAFEQIKTPELRATYNQQLKKKGLLPKAAQTTHQPVTSTLSSKQPPPAATENPAPLATGATVTTPPATGATPAASEAAKPSTSAPPAVAPAAPAPTEAAEGSFTQPSYVTTTRTTPTVSDESNRDLTQVSKDFATFEQPTARETDSESFISAITNPIGTEREPLNTAIAHPPSISAQSLGDASQGETAIQANIAASTQAATDEFSASAEDMASVLETLMSDFTGLSDVIGETTDRIKQQSDTVKVSTEVKSSGATGVETPTSLVATPPTIADVSREQVPQFKAQDDLREYRRAIAGDTQGLSPELHQVAETAARLRATPQEQWSEEQWEQASSIQRRLRRLKHVAEPSFPSEDPEDITSIHPGELQQEAAPTSEDFELYPGRQSIPQPEPSRMRFMDFFAPDFRRRRRFRENEGARQTFTEAASEEDGGGQAPPRGSGGSGGRRGRGGDEQQGEQGSGGGRSDNSWANWFAKQAIPGTVSYLAQKVAGIGAEAASPFIGEANASAVGGAGQSAANAIVGVGSIIGGAMTHNWPIAIQGVGMLVKELITIPKHLSDWSKALLDSQFTMKEWASETARTWTQVEVREILRGQASAKATAETLESSAMAWQTFSDVWRPTKDSWTNFLNKFSENMSYTIRPWTEAEGKLIKSGYEDWIKERGEWGSQRRFIQEMRKEHPEKFREEGQATYQVFEDWMRNWQNGTYMNPQSMRPVPVIQ